MRNLENFITIFCLILATSISHAGDLSYDCVIKNVYDVDDEGVLRASGWQSEFQGNMFTVSRETGKIVGKTLTTVLAKAVRVINSGSSDSSFKSIAEFEGQFHLIEMQEFKVSIDKPFVASSMGGAGLVTGICK